MFQFENLQLPNSHVKLIDHGGNDVYHITYSLALRETSIPLIVVNIEEFAKLSSERGPREAARQVCFHWLSHVYISCPGMGPPMLAISHIDKLTAENLEKSRKELIEAVEVNRKELLEESQCSGEIHNTLSNIRHLSDGTQPVFNEKEIFEFSNDLNSTSSIDTLKNHINRRCTEYNLVLPLLWEQVDKFIESQSDKVYLSLAEVEGNFPEADVKVILRYMHNSGRIMWFENLSELENCIFHQISSIAEMIAQIFHHCSEQLWRKRLENFSFFYHNGDRISKDRYEQLVSRFTSTGVLNEALLAHLLTTDSQFSLKVSVQLLKSFYILHGPIKDQLEDSYILPYFAKSYMGDSWKRDGDLQLRLDILLEGLTLPKYVFQLMTVVVLNCNADDVYNPVTVTRNGATVRTGDMATHLIHDHNNSKATLQVSCSLKLLERSWRHLLDTVKKIVELLSEVWKACRPEIAIYCSHCLFLNNAHPARDVNPKWLKLIYQSTSSQEVKALTTFDSKRVACESCSTNNSELKPTVPRPLRVPCK